MSAPIRRAQGKRKGNILLVLISGVALVAIVAAGYFWYQNQPLQQSQHQNTVPWLVQTVTPTPVPSQIDETANWKTYSSDKVGFSVKYPPDWFVGVVSTPQSIIMQLVIQDKPIDITPRPNGLTGVFSIQVQPMSYDSYFGSGNWKRDINSSLDNLPAIKNTNVEGNTAPGYSSTNISVVLGRSVYEISFPNNDSRYKTFDQILSTFKLTDLNDSETSNCSADNSLCALEKKLDDVINNKNFQYLTSIQQQVQVTCDPSLPHNDDLCLGASKGDIRKGYAWGYNQSEGVVQPADKFVSFLTKYSTDHINFIYKGRLEENNKAERIYISEDGHWIFVYQLVKSPEVWNLKSLLLGVSSKDFENLDKVTLSYFN